MAQTRQALPENFDEEVGARLRVHRDKTLESLNHRERWLLEITRAELSGDAKFDQHDPRFTYTGNLSNPGAYNLKWKKAEQRIVSQVGERRTLLSQLLAEWAGGSEAAASKV